MKKLSEIDLNLLVSLDAILATRSVTAAATKVGLSKPAMSHALQRIRAVIGDEILVRSGSRWVLTERAQSLAEPLATILAATTSLLAVARPLDLSKLAREFRIHATDHVLGILGTAIGRAVGAEAPLVDLRFLPILPDDAPALRDDVDLAIGVFPELPPDVRKQRLFEDRYCCVARTDHPRVRGKLTRADYTKLHHVLVAPRGKPGGSVDRVLAQLGEQRRVARAVPYFFAALHCVSESDCIATISVRLARTHAARFELQMIAPPVELPPYYIEQVWHPRVDDDDAHVWLRRTIAQVARELAPL